LRTCERKRSILSINKTTLLTPWNLVQFKIFRVFLKALFTKTIEKLRILIS
jgi:hypothetical protein